MSANPEAALTGELLDEDDFDDQQDTILCCWSCARVLRSELVAVNGAGRLICAGCGDPETETM